MKKIAKILVAVPFLLLSAYIVMSIIATYPIPRGNKVSAEHYTYYKNFIGIYYISVKHSLALFNHGSWGYLRDADQATFEVLDDCWAKDATHVWHRDMAVYNVDVPSFHVNASGLAVDKNHAYIIDYQDFTTIVHPSTSGIDAATAEYFMSRDNILERKWIRDKDFVYLEDVRLEVDRATFRRLGGWMIDKDFVYGTTYNNDAKKWELCRIDSIQTPIKVMRSYLINGRNVIYGNKVIIQDVAVTDFEHTAPEECRINGTLYSFGKPKPQTRE